MPLLPDAQVVLWALAEPERLPFLVREWLVFPANDVLFSAANFWEIAIKAQIGRLFLWVTVEEVVEAALASGFRELPIRAVHEAAMYRLPPAPSRPL